MPRTMLSSVGPNLTSPRWAGDFLTPDNLIRGGAKIDYTQYSAVDAVTVIVGAAGAALNAVSVPLTTALTAVIPIGTVLYFGGAKVAVLSAAGKIGDVALAVNALPAALVSADTATYKGVGAVYIPSGTIVSRTFAQRDAYLPFHPPTDTDDEYYLVAFDISDARGSGDLELYRPNNIVYENFLPTFAAASVAVKAKIRGLYRCSINAN